MDYIPNIRLKHIDNIPDKDRDNMIQILSFLKPHPYIGKYKSKGIMYLSFDEVMLIRQYMANPDVEGITKAFNIIFGITVKKVLNCKIIPFYHAYNYVIQQLELIIKAEKKMVYNKVDDMMLQAGVEKLNKLGVLNTLDALSIRYHTHPNEVKQWSYSYCFTLLSKMRIEQHIQDNYNEIIKQKK